jgi:glucose/mannose transport system permease protein
MKTKLRLGKKWLYIPLVAMAVFYLIPMYVMLVTGFKSFAEIDLKTMWNLPQGIHFDNYIEAFSKLAPSLWNSFIMVIPAAIISSMLGSLNGFILAKWKFRGADVIFPFILFGMFIPYQSILIPLVIFINNTLSPIGLGGIPALILAHIIYGIPITTLTFRNYYASLLPISIPSFVVVLIWQFTSAWNDFLFAVVLTGNRSWPITVALNNMAGSQIISWNVQMAGSLLAALPTLLVYIFLGRYFLRGLLAGSLKG